MKAEKRKRFISLFLAFVMLITFTVSPSWASGITKAQFETGISKELKKAIDFADSINEITVKKKTEEGLWEEDDTFREGDEVNVYIDYSIEAGIIHSGQSEIFYQLPPGVKLIEEQSGDVFSGKEKVGKYTISKDAKITINFNKEFIEDEEECGIDGMIQFNGKITTERLDGEEQVRLPDGSTITILPEEGTEIEEDEFDIKVKKEGELQSDKKKIIYKVQVSTEKGTEGKVEIKDYINNNNSVNIEYKFLKNSLLLIKEDSYGGGAYVEDYQIEWFNNEDAKHDGFVIKDLPALEAGEKYIVHYEVEISSKKGHDVYRLYNNAIATSESKKSEDQNKIEWFKTLKKTGSYDKESGLIHWEIEVRPQNNWTLIDDIKGEVHGDIRVISENPWKEETIKPDAYNRLSYTFTNVKEGQIYRFSFYTRPKKGETEVENTAWLNGETDTAVVDIIAREENLVKTGEGTLSEDEKTMINKWNLKATFEEGIKDEIVIRDYIEKPKEGEHYAIASELEKTFKIRLDVKIDNKTYYRYNGGKNVVHSQKGEVEEIGIEVRYFDEYNEEVEADDEKTKVLSFEIRIKPNKRELWGLSIHEYKTYTDLSKLEPGAQIKSKNLATMSDLKSSAETEYSKSKRTIKKEVRGVDGSRIKYRIFIETSSKDNGDIEIKDKLPEGTHFIGESLKACFYINENIKKELLPIQSRKV